MRCPDCGAQISTQTNTCAGGHSLETEEGILVLMTADERHSVDSFLTDFETFRQHRGEQLTDVSLYDDLPFSRPLRRHPVWRLRAHDARLIDGLLRGHDSARILDLGAWNCWLSHHLAVAGHRVVAVDGFTDKWDGLGARRHYSEGEWTTIRMDLNRVDLIDEKFDLIVVNRAFQMLEDPHATLGILRRRLEPGGVLLLTGLNIIADTSAVAAHFETLRREFTERFDRPLGVTEFKGYLDADDAVRLRSAGVCLRPYLRQLPATIWAYVDRRRPRFLYGIMRSST